MKTLAMHFPTKLLRSIINVAGKIGFDNNVHGFDALLKHAALAKLSSIPTLSATI